MPSTNLALANARRDDREEVHHRTTAIGLENAWPATIVNVSPNGLMARCDGVFAVGDPVAFRLPGLPPLAARIIWTLGGRIGCEFADTIPAAQYFALLPRLR